MDSFVVALETIGRVLSMCTFYQRTGIDKLQVLSDLIAQLDNPNLRYVECECCSVAC